MSNTKDTPMDYKQFEGHYDDALEKYLNEGINYGANTIANADVEDLKQLASY